MGGLIPFGCGQCHPCRINRRRQWMWRQVLESMTHEENAYVTLTYSEMPGNGSLQPEHLTLFLKRLRWRIAPKRVRYFAVGEYGEETRRPHYHLSLFGLSGFSDWVGSRQIRSGCADIVHECWGHGNVDVKPFARETAQYVAGYVVKKMTDKNDVRLAGRYPEFARMSRMPALGSAAMAVMAKQLSENWHWLEESGPPVMLAVGNQKIQLGRTMIKKLIEAMGFTDEYVQQIKDQKSLTRSVELLPLLLSSVDDASSSLKKEVVKANLQKIMNLEGRTKIYEQRKKL